MATPSLESACAKDGVQPPPDRRAATAGDSCATRRESSIGLEYQVLPRLWRLDEIGLLTDLAIGRGVPTGLWVAMRDGYGQSGTRPVGGERARRGRCYVAPDIRRREAVRRCRPRDSPPQT